MHHKFCLLQGSSAILFQTLCCCRAEFDLYLYICVRIIIETFLELFKPFFFLSFVFDNRYSIQLKLIQRLKPSHARVVLVIVVRQYVELDYRCMQEYHV